METLDANNPKHARADDKLRHEIAAWLTTVTAEGQPQSTPIWFHWDGSTFLIYSQPEPSSATSREPEGVAASGQHPTAERDHREGTAGDPPLRRWTP
jgi:hypothetical protein